MRLIVLCSETTAGIVETVPEVFDISMTSARGSPSKVMTAAENETGGYQKAYK